MSKARDPFLVVVVAIAIALAVADSSVVVLALPEIFSEFDVSIVGVSWTITAYNIAIVLGALAVLPLEARVKGYVFAAIGLVTFAAASLVAGVASSFEILIVARTVQGVGAALALAGTVPVLRGILQNDRHAVHVWGIAATVGAALGPALGGVLTQLFSWRAIFLFQAPVSALALVVVLEKRVRDVAIAPRAERLRNTLRANLGFFLLYGALVGALFLGVLLLVVVWGYEPLAGALVVSTLPAGTILVRRLGPNLPSWLGSLTGGVALAGGLVSLAYLPAAEAIWAAAALFACGIGLGLLGGGLGPEAVPVDDPGVRAATVSIAARHAGFVVALAIIAPVLSSAIDTAALDATKATTAEVLDAPIRARQKVDVALQLRDLVADTPRGEVPDPAVVFDELGADSDGDLAQTRDDVVGAIRDTLTRAFRSSFMIAALFGAAAALVALFLPFVHPATRSVDAIVAAVAIMAGVGLLLGAQFRAGARDYGTREYEDPCTAPADPYPEGDGLDGTLQRIALGTLNGAACELGTTREVLVLSLEPKSGFGPEVDWTEETLEDALHAGLDRAIDDADERDSIPGWVASAMKFAVRNAPIDWLLGRIDVPFLED